MPWRTHLAMSAAHVAGGVVGGVLASALLWLAATPIRTLVPVGMSELLVAAVAILALAVDAKLLRLRRNGTVAPASLRATAFSKALYRAPAARRIWTGVSMALTAVVLAVSLYAT